jgi:hypothetical protein
MDDRQMVEVDAAINVNFSLRRIEIANHTNERSNNAIHFSMDSRESVFSLGAYDR